MLRKVLMTLLALLLIVYGLRGPIAAIGGTTTDAVVTSVEKKVKHQKNKNGTITWNIHYRYTSADGKSHETYYTVGDADDIKISGTIIKVNYLPFAPFFSAPDEQAVPNLTALIFVALGIVIFIFGVRMKEGNDTEWESPDMNNDP